ncbi:MAG: hypothetical protein M1823_007220, partial [Watsoniomyces obsoletus]
MGNLKSVEYFLSDAPLNRYLEFSQTFRNDKRIQSLAKADGGIEKALANWLGTRLDLSAHMAVMAPSGRDGKTPLLDYILRAMPDALDVKSKAEGKTPLQLAFELNKLSAAQTLIQAGANQATRNHLGENLLHTILTNSNLANQLLLERLREARPADFILSEESVDDRARCAARRVWIVDPLDGTREYAEGLDDWAVHIGLAIDGRPHTAAVAIPALAKVYATDDGPRFHPVLTPPRMV